MRVLKRTSLFLVVSSQFQGLNALAVVVESSSIPDISTSTPVRTKEAIVVGGGPVGLATALTLSNQPHCYNVTLLEKSEQVAFYDPSRAYQYNVNVRGLQWVDQFPCVLEKLQIRGLAPKERMGRICYVPADPSEPIPPVKSITEVKIRENRNFWVPRHFMVQLLGECCREQEVDRLSRGDNQKGSIRLLYDKEVDSVEADSTDMLTVRCVDGSTYTASLLVGADGVDSQVRSALADSQKGTWLQSKAKKFQVRKYRSPSTGLRMKSLQFPPNFRLANTTGETIATAPETMYVLRSVNKGRRNYFSLGLLPVKDSTLVRAANINTRWDHEVWGLETGQAVKEFFAKSFPRIAWDDLVDKAEWERFAKASGTTYPFCQFSPGSSVASPSGDTGVVLVGDACHAFPPDIGQGINAGLNDVLALDRALRGQDITTGKDTVQPESLSAALSIYEENRGPEHKALIRLAKVGAPYQYRQPWLRDRLGRFFWTCNVVVRMILNKFSGGFIPPPVIVLMQQPELTFRQVMRRGAVTARLLKVGIITLIFFLSRRRL